MMDDASVRGVRTLARRIRLALFLEGAALATAILALAVACTLLAARALGFAPEPAPAWSAAALLPVLAGAVRALAAPVDHARCAVWLDRRLGLRGLLVTALETDASAWAAALRPRLAAAGGSLPRVAVRPLLVRVAGPLAFLAVVLVLPPPELAAPRANPAVAAALAELAGRVDLLAEQRVLPPGEADELRARLAALAEDLRGGERVSWSDVDALAARMDHAQAVAASALRNALAALGGMGAGSEGGAASELAQQLAELLAKAASAGLLRDLPPELAAQLAAALGAEGGIDAAALPRSAEELAALAARLGELFAGRLRDLAAAGLAEDLPLAELAGLDLASLRAGEPAHVHTELCPGGS
jgi:hypothetical protein